MLLSALSFSLSWCVLPVISSSHFLSPKEYRRRLYRMPITTNFDRLCFILVTRASDLMAAHDPRLWETLQDFSQILAIWTSRRMLLEQTGN